MRLAYIALTLGHSCAFFAEKIGVNRELIDNCAIFLNIAFIPLTEGFRFQFLIHEYLHAAVGDT